MSGAPREHSESRNALPLYLTKQIQPRFRWHFQADSAPATFAKWSETDAQSVPVRPVTPDLAVRSRFPIFFGRIADSLKTPKNYNTRPGNKTVSTGQNVNRTEPNATGGDMRHLQLSCRMENMKVCPCSLFLRKFKPTTSGCHLSKLI